jgi:hypothetical protein
MIRKPARVSEKFGITFANGPVYTAISQYFRIRAHKLAIDKEGYSQYVQPLECKIGRNGPL